MDYKYIPDTFDWEKIIRMFGSKEKFLETQIKYKKGFEKVLAQFLDIEEINGVFSSLKICVPRIEDSKTNIYRNYSMFACPYVYVRNNYKVENLSKLELEMLEGTPTTEFFLNTYGKVMFESGDVVFYGIPNDVTKAQARSITFEFAYDQVKCQSVEELRLIEDSINRCRDIIATRLKSQSIPVSFVVYNGIPKHFSDDQQSMPV